MKNYLKLISYFAVFVFIFLFFHSSASAIVASPIFDGGGGSDYITNNAPAFNSAKWNPPSQTYPNNGSINGNIRPYVVVGNNPGVYDHSTAVFKMYVQYGQTFNLTVNNAGPACHNEQSAGLVGPDYAQNSSSYGPTTYFNLEYHPGGNAVPIGSAKIAGRAADCTSSVAFPTITIGDTNSDCITDASKQCTFYKGANGEYYDRIIYLRAKALDSQIQGENSFWFNTSSPDAAVGMGNGYTGYGYRDQNLNNGNYWTNSVTFGVDYACEDAPGTSYRGGFFYQDADATNTAWNPNIHIKVQRQSWGTKASGPDSTWVDVVDRGPSWLAAHESGGEIWAPNTVNPAERYRVLIMNAGVRNTVFIQVTGSLSQFSGRYHVYPSDCQLPIDASCTATPSAAKVNVGQTDSITVKIKNNTGSGGNLTSSYQVRQYQPGGQAKNISGTVAPGGSQTLPAYTISARSTAQTVTFYYALYDGNGDVVGNKPLCNTTITWGNPPTGGGLTGGGTIAVSCSDVNISNVHSDATYKPQIAMAGRARVVQAVFLNDGGGGGTGGTGGTGTGGTGTGTGPVYGPATKITQVPVALKITDDSNGNTFTYIIPGGVSNTKTGGSGNYSISSYGIPGFQMWPHKSYTFELFIQGAEANETSPNAGQAAYYSNNGYWNPPNDANQGGYYYSIHSFGTGNTFSNGPCFEPSCGTPSTVDSEPGQTKNFSYGVHITNRTQQTYDPNDGNGYHFSVNSSGGLANVSGANASPAMSPGNPTNINVNFSGRTDYTYNFGITMYFQGSPLDTPTMPGGVCNSNGGGTPATRPFIEARGGDVKTGGAFLSANATCGGAGDPPYISPTAGNNYIEGGVRTFGMSSGGINRGSKGEFGVDSLGSIYSGNMIAFYAKATFANANYPSNSMGGFFNGGNGGVYQAHCVKDYYDSTRKSASLPGFSGGNVSGLNGQYQANGNITISGGTILAGQRATIYVNGDVEISGNINYANNWNAADQTNVPYFALIVKGNIIVHGGVNRMDGLYIAQPNGNQDGEFSTCDNTNYEFCASQLVVNGAVIAQHIQLLRAHGTLGPLDADINNICRPYSSNNCPPAEIFNYVPSMVIGLPEMLSDTNGAVIPSTVEGLFNLPPVF